MSRWICSSRLMWLLPLTIATGCVSGSWLPWLSQGAIAQTSTQEAVPADSTATDPDPTASLCPMPALARVRNHTVLAGETVESIAAAYNLLPATLLGMNPPAQVRLLDPGMTLRIPPFNGIEVQVRSGQTWQDMAAQYGLRADILFEVNGCPATIPAQIFIPGVNWFPGVTTTAASGTASNATTSTADPLTGYPLSAVGTIVTNFGWQPHPDRDELVFNSGLTLSSSDASEVLAVGDGTVAYVGPSEGLGTLIVVNHAQGLQTRYAQMGTPQVKLGDRVKMGQVLATRPSPADGAMTLYFEVRSNSALGWVARDPGTFIPALAVR